MPLKANTVILCWPNYVDAGSISGGSYRAAFPLSNAKDRVFAKRARSTDLTAASTQFSMFTTQQKQIYSFALAAHNLTSTATIRIQVFKDLGQTILLHDSGFVNVWPAVFPSSELEWEFDNFWFGGLTEEEKAQFTPFFHYFLPDVALGQSVKAEILDTSNPAGYIEFGRAFFSGAWQPTFNMGQGVSFGYLDQTTVEEADDGTEYFDARPKKRTVDFDIPHLSEPEAFNFIYRMKKTQGIDKEILFAYTNESTVENSARVFLARMRTIDPLTHPYFNNYANSFSLQEIL